MSLFQSLTYGIIQGLTEFLPISSSAHLILLPVFTGWSDPGLGFNVALHWGTLIAVIIYFRSEVRLLLQNSVGFLKGGREPRHWLPLHISMATIPGALLGFMFEHQAETIFRSPLLLCFTLSLLALGLYLSDRIGSKSKTLDQMTWPMALLIGISQGIAIVPGISRSGITMTMGLLLGLRREEAVRFSFYLAMPITLGAGLLKSQYLLAHLTDPNILLGLFTSALAGWAAIHILLTYVKTKSFTPFVVYRLILAGGLWVWLQINH